MTARPECPAEVVDALIVVEQHDQPCWRVKKYLGSMLTFDFGDRLAMTSLRGEPFEIGSSTIGVRDVWWRASGPGLEALDSNELHEQTQGWRRLDAALQGAALASCVREGPDVVLGFSNGVRFQLDTTNIYEEEADAAVAVLRLSGGACFDLMPDGRFIVNLELSRGGREEAA